MLKNRLKLTFLIFCVFLFGICIYSSAQEGFKYDSKGERNPFIPLVTSEGRLLQLERTQEKGDISVEGIIYDKTGLSYCIVNGSVVKVGDFVSGFQVLKIEKNKVVFIKDGQTKEAEIKKEEK